MPEGLTSTVTRALAEHAPARGASTRQGRRRANPSGASHWTSTAPRSARPGHRGTWRSAAHPRRKLRAAAAEAPGLALVSPGSGRHGDRGERAGRAPRSVLGSRCRVPAGRAHRTRRAGGRHPGPQL
ncbi:hypothetical protein QJS66_11345 [Kocuria rhizophila]|nr:hypothetical protein QJS66_11345 [Kocuria rhizophila]